MNLQLFRSDGRQISTHLSYAGVVWITLVFDDCLIAPVEGPCGENKGSIFGDNSVWPNVQTKV